MFGKLIKLAFVGSAFLIATSVSAATNDWTGSFTVSPSKGQSYSVDHYPNRVTMYGGMISGGLGVHINGVDLETKMNVEQFTAEVKKLGAIASQQITLGATYTAQ